MQAVCTCGWTSLPLPSATRAGTAWDAHLRNVERGVVDIAAMERTAPEYFRG